MALHIQDFTSAINNPAKPFLWDVFIPSLPFTTGIRAQTAQWPGVGSTDIDLFHMGQLAKFSGTVEYEHTWTVAIVESEFGDVYNALYAWRQLVFDQETGVGGNPAIYKRDIEMRALTSEGQPWAIIVLRQCYPKNIDPVDLDKANNTEAWRFNVVWNYDWWELQ